MTTRKRPPTEAALLWEATVTDSYPPKLPASVRGCGFAIGVLLLVLLSLVGLLSTHLALGLTRRDDAFAAGVFAVIVWALWLGLAVLLFRASQKRNEDTNKK